MSPQHFKQKRRDTRDKLNQIYREIGKATDNQRIRELKAEAERLGVKLKTYELVERRMRKSQRRIGRCKNCGKPIMFGEMFFENNHGIFCSLSHVDEYFGHKK